MQVGIVKGARVWGGRGVDVWGTSNILLQPFVNAGESVETDLFIVPFCLDRKYNSVQANRT